MSLMDQAKGKSVNAMSKVLEQPFVGIGFFKRITKSLAKQKNCTTDGIYLVVRRVQ